MRVTFSKKGEKGNRKGLPKGIFQNKVSSGKANGRIMLFGGNILPRFNIFALEHQLLFKYF